MDQKSIFYVYVLFDQFGIPRYVGKGKGHRWNDHSWQRTKNQIKNKFIQETLAAMGEIPKVKVRENISEVEAFETEVALIAAIGRRDLKTGPLTNMSEGGTGGDFGEIIRKVKANWTPEERAAHAETYRASSNKWWSKLTDDARRELVQKMFASSIEARKRLKETDPDYEIKRNQKIKEGHAKRTPEQKAESSRQGLSKFSREAQSETLRKFHASQTPEERLKRVMGSATPEEFIERTKRQLVGSRTHDEISAQVIFQQANLTEEQKTARSKRASYLGKNTRWITDGRNNRRLKQGDPVPTGLDYGKTSVQSLSPEERSSYARRAWEGLTSEQRSARVRGKNFDHSARSRQVVEQQSNLTKEQKIARDKRARAMAANNTGRSWITDGKTNKRLKPSEPLPEGWLFGQKPRMAASILSQSEIAESPTTTELPALPS